MTDSQREPVFLHLNEEFPQTILNFVDRHNIRMVYWDLGGTLVDLSPTMKERVVKRINMKYHRNISVEMYEEAIRTEWTRRETPQAQKKIKAVNSDEKEREYWIDFYTSVLGNLGIRVKNQQIVKWLATVQSNPKSFKELPFMRQTLEKLITIKVKMGIISNAFPSARKILEDCGLVKEFKTQHIILSYEYNSIKPEKDIYQKAIDKAKVKAHEILFIDDRKSFVDGAARHGMMAVVITESEGKDFGDPDRSDDVVNEYSEKPWLAIDKSYLNSLFKEIQVLLTPFIIGFLCSQEMAGFTKFLSLRQEMWWRSVRSYLRLSMS
jgi:HAD superfamily hydrolase (TIGR01509 family)